MLRNSYIFLLLTLLFGFAITEEDHSHEDEDHDHEDEHHGEEEHGDEETWAAYSFDETGYYTLQLSKEGESYHADHIEFMLIALGDTHFDDVDIHHEHDEAVEGSHLEQAGVLNPHPVSEDPLEKNEIDLDTNGYATFIFLNITEAGNYAIFATPALDDFGGAIHDPDGHTIAPYEEGGHGHGGHDDEDELSNGEVWLYALLGGAVGTVASLMAAFSTNMIDRWESIEAPFTWLAAGVISAVGGMHLISEVDELASDAWAGDWKYGLCFVIGVFIGLFIDVVAGSSHDHSTGGIKSTDPDVEMSGLKTETAEGENSTKDGVDDSGSGSSTCSGLSYTCLVGDALHNFFDGFIIAQAFDSCSLEKGWVISLAILVHEIPQEVSDFLVLIRSGCSFRNALLANVGVSLTSFIGVFVYMGVKDNLAEEDIAYMIAVSAGVFVMIGIELVRSSGGQITGAKSSVKVVCLLSFCVGAAIIAGLMQWHPHCGDHDGHDH